MKKKALITGITGQDGAYLAKMLIEKGYSVTGTYRRVGSFVPWRLQELGIIESKDLAMLEMDLTDPGRVFQVISQGQYDEIYNLGAQSFVSSSFSNPVSTAEISGTAVVHLLEAIRMGSPESKFYQASTSEMFGKVQSVPQTETTDFYPRSPYGIAKLYAHWMVVNYRESYGLFSSSGILFNHESPLRGRDFVTRKITDGVAKIKLGLLAKIELGNLDAKRDWGYAADYVDGMWRMLQTETPDTFILATGRTESVRDFIKLAFNAVDIDLEFQGSGDGEAAVNTATGQTVVSVSPQFYRPAEVDLLVGDARKAKANLGWEASATLEELCRLMIDADLRRNSGGKVF